jgi:CheY-like chemotaxis protein
MSTVRDSSSGKYDLRLLSAALAICAASGATGLAAYDLPPALDIVLVLGLAACAVAVLLISRMQAGAALHSLRSALDAAPAGIACFDRNQRLTFWNRSYGSLLEALGVTPALGLGFDVVLTAGVSGSEGPRARSDQEFARGHPQAEFELPDGRTIRAQCDPAGDGGMIAVLVDVTALQRTQALAATRREDAPADKDAATPHRRLDASAAGAAPRGRLRVLAAEDNLTNQVVLAALLESLDVDLMMTADGEEALAAYRAADFDLVLMDIQMPNMGGEEATRAIRAWETDVGLARTPILAVTANVMSEQIGGYMAAGMDGVIAKPIEVTKLFEGLRNVLPLREAA